MDEIDFAKMPCPACGTPVSGEDNFCGDCGAKLDHTPAAPPPPRSRLDRVLITEPQDPQDDVDYLRTRILYFAGCGSFLLSSPFLLWVWIGVIFHLNNRCGGEFCRRHPSLTTLGLALLGQILSTALFAMSLMGTVWRHRQLGLSKQPGPALTGFLFTLAQFLLLIVFGLAAAVKSRA